MRAQFAPFVPFSLFACAGLTTLTMACSDDPDPGSDTIDDTSEVVDTSETSDGTDTTDATETETTLPDVPDATEATETTPDAEVIQPVLAVVVNEVAAAGDPNDWIELYNAGTATVDMTGWLLRDGDPAHAYVFAPGSSLAAGAYLVLERDDTGLAGFNFGLGGADSVLLYDVDSNLVNQTSWNEGESPAGRTWGRAPNGSGMFKTLVTPTRGEANIDNPNSTCGNNAIEGLEVCDGTALGDLTCRSFGWGSGTLSCIENCTRVSQTACVARAAGLVLNEVESDETDRIEIFNGTANAIDLAGFTVADGGTGTYELPEDSVIAAGGYMVLERDLAHTFGLGDEDTVTLYDTDDEVVDQISWAPGRAVPAYCRTPNGTGGFRTCDEQTFGNENF